MNINDLENFIARHAHAHLVGIGGVSMRPLGLVLKGMGMEVTGSDMSASMSTEELIEQGIHVEIGHRAENIQGADCIIRTAAAHNDNPEIAAARSRGIPLFERAQAWGILMEEYRDVVCVSGTHGKTTTSSLIKHILELNGGCNYFIGSGDGKASLDNKYYVVESDEYNRHSVGSSGMAIKYATDHYKVKREPIKTKNQMIEELNGVCDKLKVAGTFAPHTEI